MQRSRDRVPRSHASAGRAGQRLAYSSRVTRRAIAASGWVPAALLAIVTVGTLVAYGTPPVSLVAFGLYVALGLALPGMLWVRLARRASAHISEDVLLGLVVGYAIELGTYLVARAVGLPLLFLLWPVATLVGFAAVPRLRWCWRGSGITAPAGWSWALAALLGYIVWYSAATFFAQHPLSGTYVPYVDMPYHLALIGELKHHVAPWVPYVAGVPLAYHWFFYAEAAATSWATGIDPVVLLYRLSVLPMLAAFVVLTAAAARRLTGAWWSGPAAAAIAVFGTVATPYAAVRGSVFDAQTLQATWISPTNAFGLALFGGALLVFVDLVAEEGHAKRRTLCLTAVLVLAASGAKASLLPLLIAGLLVVVVGTLIGRRRLHLAAAEGLVLAVVGALLAVALVYRWTSGGLVIGFQSLRLMPLARWVGAVTAHGLAAVAVPLVTLAIALVLWSFLWAGVYGLLARRRWTATTPALLFLAGICAAAIGAVVLFRYPGLSEIYYMRGATAAFALLAVAGIAALVPAGADRVRLGLAMAGAALLGAGAVTLVVVLGHPALRTLGSTSLARVVIGMLLPIGALVVVATAGAFAARALARRDRRLAGAAPLLVVALVMGFSLPAVARLVVAPLSAGPLAGPAIPGDAIAAARWLRDNSSPDDLVATNLHCRPVPGSPGTCDARQFWASAYTERRMLVEGWAYTAPAVAEALRSGNSDLVAVPFWDQPRLTANDLAFTAPSSDSIAALRDTYGVRWLFADLASANADGLAQFAALRYRSGDFAVYEIP